MFADDINLFCAEKNIKIIFETVNNELAKNFSMVHLKKLYLNVTKTNILFFHKPSKNDNIPLALLKLYIDNNQIQQSESITS